MLLFLCFLIELLLIVLLYTKQSFTLNLFSFILYTIIGFVMMTYHMVTVSIPYDMFIIVIVAMILLLIKHRYIFKLQTGRFFILQLSHHFYTVGLFAVSCLYISTIPLIIINSLALWAATIAFSTIYSFIGYLSWSTTFENHQYYKHVKLIMVLGAGIFSEEVTTLLAARLDKALSVYHSQRTKPIIIVSGGQGPDEPISEALAMKRYLIAHNVPENHIFMENQSTNTRTNFLYSKSIIHSMMPTSSHMLCVTSQFHVLRALKFAKKAHLSFDGIGSRTPYHFLAQSMIIDFLGLMYQYKTILTIYFAMLFWLAILQTI
ncbi:YdcF family protein [Staphylococcus epidermidis]|uniref:YdcF family protein n=1 Tax=Staphylococcus epidermidis TaxID=1282 RepID=UPI00119F1430|nr:YdcF family protein [Staphylococcus epidermidis]MBM0783684.1 YdcF family protein [Staphylococcus epidermidis]MBM0813277.1 YdcF family protein [Staphylococcus epidermidis]MCG1458673.1 YdcF family protein [Staphylococcus epidermidis]MCG1569898.1 YdcF family protein [Staphylococcus epidermidis]MCG2215349.1 YdcF family protein [Staphylococcus epidermidis]